MEEWMAMRVMKGAHVIGLKKLDEFGKAVDKLKSGEKAEAIQTFEEMQQFFANDLEMHFRHEEQALFPAMAKIIGRMGPVEAMLEEHDSLWRSIEKFGELLPEIESADQATVARLTPATERVVRHIVFLLTSHIQKEDTMLFPMAERILDMASKQEVDENVEKLEALYGTKA